MNSLLFNIVVITIILFMLYKLKGDLWYLTYLLFIAEGGWMERNYETVVKVNNLSTSGVLNMGLWENTTSLDEAHENMFKMIYDETGMKDPNKNIWEFGIGYGKHYDLWMKHGIGDNTKIKGFDITQKQVDRISGELGANDHISVYQHDATKVHEIELHGTPDIILSIESAFHFNTRIDFIKRAYETLPANGILYLTDITHSPGSGGFGTGIFNNTLMQLPEENYMSVADIEKEVKKIGFREVRVEDITQKTIVPFSANFNKDYVLTKYVTESLFLNNGFSYYKLVATK
jgi:cyclopropane fatty-acyl-phospholipid synthase-like methyltransferase